MKGKFGMRQMKKIAIGIVFVFTAFSAQACSCSEKDMASIYTESNTSTAVNQNDISSSRQNAITRAVQKCSPAVVGINVTEVRQVTYRDPFFDSPFGDDPIFERFRRMFGGGDRTRKYKVQGLGSGYIISSDGYILTNHHVAGNASKIVVTLSGGEKYDAEIIGSDMASDVALLKIDAKNLPFLTLGNSDNVLVGEWSIAFGNPFGLFDKNAKPTVTVGVVSNIGVNFVQEDNPNFRVYKGMIQTDAAISSGNSGGPLVNSLGEVIGMNTVIFSTAQSNQGAGSIGIGFAIPINRVKNIVDKLKKDKKIDRDFYVGMDVREIDEEIAKYLKTDKKDGVVVFSVERNSAADQAGIEPGDIILAVNGEHVVKPDDFWVEIGDGTTGEKMKIDVLRGDEKLSKTLELKQRKGR